MRTYTFIVVIEQGRDEFWEAITVGGKSGCDELRSEISHAIAEHGFAGVVSLHSYKDHFNLA